MLLSINLKIKTYRTIILPVVLYVCETWSLKFKEKRRLILFENRVLRRVFGPKRDEVKGTGENCILSSLGIFNLTQYCGRGKIEKNEMVGVCDAYG